MSPPGRPKGEYRSAQHEGSPVSAPAPRATFRLPVRVYYEDTDMSGVVYYANYLRFLERARTEWLAALGFELSAVEREHGITFVVHHVDIRYHQPARLGDRLEVTAALEKLGHARMLMRQDVRRDAQTLVEARVTLACLDRIDWRPARIPAPLAQRMETTV
jgi:acyl-CoA thioester hydrolase